MKLEQVKEIANAVLYEGYLLYPYRQSALKNRTRWTFGVVYPREYSEVNGDTEPWTMHTECLIEGKADDVLLNVTVRFLHLFVSTVIRQQPEKDERVEANASEWGLASRLADEPLQEGMEREVGVENLPLRELLGRNEDFLSEHLSEARGDSLVGARNKEDFLSEHLSEARGDSLVGARNKKLSPYRVAIEFPAARTVEHTLDGGGTEIIREQQALVGAFLLTAESIDTNTFKLHIDIENTTPGTSTVTTRRDAILFQSFVSTHTILQVRQGSFISLLDPPEGLGTFAKECQNIRTWPVLIGHEGERDVMLSSPIILYDYPQIAPESPGALFDGGEIDEILSLRIMTLSDEEKAQMRRDEHTREILERTESLTPEQFMKMHGTIRDLRPISGGETV